MKTRLITSASGVLLAAAFATAEDSPKLVPRPVPGLFDALHAEKASNDEALALLESALGNKPAPPITDVPIPAAGGASGESESGPAPASTKAKAYVPPSETPAEGNARARILFIHRRATLPPQMTADLAKPGPVKEGQKGVSTQVVATRPGKIRIIPKSEVASLLAPAPPPKPSAP